jgi:hypothetical protein
VSHSGGLRRGGLFGGGGGREEIVVVGVDGVVDSVAPVAGAKGVDVFVLGEADGLEEHLRQLGDVTGGFGFYVAADDGGDEACEGDAEIAGGEGMVADARGAATAAIRECKPTQGHAVLCSERGHKSLLRVEFWDCLLRSAQAEAMPLTRKNAGKMPAVQTGPKIGIGGRLPVLPCHITVQAGPHTAVQ